MEDDLRVAESAAYNLREALDAVVSGRDASSGGMQEVIESWRHFQTSLSVGPDEAEAETALQRLLGTLERIADDERREAYRTRQLIHFLRDRTGVEPLRGPSDRPTLVDDQNGQTSASLGCERSVSVSHEDLQLRVGVVTPSVLEVLAIRLHLGVHNLCGNYS